MPMDRRTFLSTLAAASTGTAAPARIRIAFLGGSHSHALAKAKVIRASQDWELAGIAESDPKILQHYTGLGITPLTREQILTDPSITVVAIESDVKDHSAGASAALNAGKHIHVEKPPADTMQAFRDMAATAEKKRLLIQTGYMWRYNPAINAAFEAARNGWLGDVYLLRAVMNADIRDQRRQDIASFKGGAMFEYGSHLVDLTVRLLGRPGRVTPFLRKDGNYADSLNDNTLAVLQFPRAIAMLQTSVMQPNQGPHRTIEIQGTNGTASVKPIEPPGLEIDLDKPAGPYKAGRQTVPMPSYTRFIDDFAELAGAVRGRRPLSVPLHQELLVQETLLRACDM